MRIMMRKQGTGVPPTGPDHVVYLRGNDYTDSSKNNLVVTNSGTNVVSSGKFENAIDFKNDSHVIITNDGSLNHIGDVGYSYTVDMWVLKYGNWPQYGGLFSMAPGSNTGPVGIALHTNGDSVQFFNGTGSSPGNVITVHQAPQNLVWTHIAVMYDHTTTTAYVYYDGILKGSEFIYPIAGPALDLVIGQRYPDYQQWRISNTIIDEFRITNGCLWTPGENFTPPTSIATDYGITTKENDPYWSSVKALLRGQMSDESSIGRNVIFNGSVTTQPSKWGDGYYMNGGSSISIDGTGDDFLFTGDFTIEGWFSAPDTQTTYTELFKMTKYQSGTYMFGLAMYPNTNQFLIWMNGQSYERDFNSLYLSNAPDATHHIAFVRKGTGYNIFINGRGAYGWNEGSVRTLGFSNVNVAIAAPSAPHYQKFDDFRITNGVARYTSEFDKQTLVEHPTSS